MGKSMKKLLLLIFVSMLFVFPIVSAEDHILINSENWVDVYSAMLYGSLVELPASFLVSDKHSTLILGGIPQDNEIRVISSRQDPFIVGYENVLSGVGYNAVEDIYNNVNLELAEDLDVTNFIIVDDSYGYNAISVAPYAVVSDSYVIFADRANLGQVEDFLEGRQVNSVIIYGNVERQVRDALAQYNPEIINKEGDRFANNIEINKKYLAIKQAKQALLTNGEFIEKEIMSGIEPVIFIGANNVPDQIRDFIQESGIDIGILVGNELVGTATTIRRSVGISVFVKFAQGARAPQGSISQVEALDMFYLPIYNLNIEIDSMRYNSATGQLEVNIRNTQDQAVYFKGTYDLTSDDGEQTVGDIDAIFLEGNELKTIVYDVEPLIGETITADAYVIYGESKGSLEKVVDLTMEVTTVDIDDFCEIDLTSLVYDKRRGEFTIETKNKGEVDCYVNLEISDLLVDGVPTSVGAEETVLIKEGQTRKVRIRIRLTDEDIFDNEEVTVRGYYGEREDGLVHAQDWVFEMKLAGIDYVFWGMMLVIIILLFLIIWRRRKKKKEEDEELE